MQNPKSKILSLRNVGLHYSRRNGILSHAKFWALRDISLDLFKGETLGVIGKNGVGKSTLLRLLAGIISPDKGHIQFYHPETKISLISLQAGFVPSLNGRDNAILSGMLLGSSRKEIESEMESIINFSELGDFFEQPVQTYSAGMRTRLGFSIAYYANPDVMLLDEVLGVGDENFKQKSTKAMKERIKSEKTVVLASHNTHLLREVCDRLLWIEDGTTREQGRVTDVLEAYLKNTQSKHNNLKRFAG